MTFKPNSARFSTEEITDDDTVGFTLSDSSIMGIQDSAIRQIPQLGIAYPTGVQWAAVGWNSTEHFLPDAFSIDTGWDASFTNFATGSPIQWEFDLQSVFLKVETNTSEFFNIEQSSTGVFGNDFTGVLNSTGWTIQTKIQVGSSDTGSPVLGHSLFLSDDSRSAEIYFVDSGLGLREDTGSFLVTDMTVPREIRIGAKQNDIYILLDDGLAYAGIDKFTGTDTAQKKIRFGNTGIGSDGVIGTTYIDYLHQYYGGLVLDTGSTPSVSYATGLATVTTPEFSPNQNVKQFSAAYFDLSIGLSGGTTESKVQYQSSTTSSVWTDYNSFETFTGFPVHQVLLDNVPTAGDGTDKLRFIVRQSSTDGSAEAARVERISVASIYDDTQLRGFPRWGPKQGGNTIALELHTTRAFNAPAINTALDKALYRLDETGTATGLVDIVAGNSGNLVGTFTTQVASSLGTQIQLGSINLDTSSVLETIFDGSYLPTGDTGFVSIAGEIASGFVPIKTSSAGDGLYFEITQDVTGATAEFMAGQTISAQKIYAQVTGDGMQATGLTATGAGRQVISFNLQMEHGALDVNYSTDSGQNQSFFPLKYDYKGTREFRFITAPMVADIETGTLKFTNASGLPGAGRGLFTVSNLHMSTLDEGSIIIPTTTAYDIASSTGHTNTGWSIDMFLTPYAYNINETGSVLFNMTGTSHVIDMKLNNMGYPVSTITSFDGTIALTGSWPLLLDERKNVCLTYYNRTGTDTGYAAILVDGEVNALERTNIPGGQLNIHPGEWSIGAEFDSTKPYYGLVDQVRFSHSPAKPESHAQRLGLTDMYFRDVLEVPAYTGDGTLANGNETVSLLHFNEEVGPIVDDCEFWGKQASEVLSLHHRRPFNSRKEKGVIGRAMYFTKDGGDNGGIYIPENGHFNQKNTSQPMSLFFYFGGYTDTGANSSLVRYKNDSNYGYEVFVNNSGYMEVSLFTGAEASNSPYIHTGLPIGTNVYTACGIAFDVLTQRVVTMVDSTVEAHSVTNPYTGYLTGGEFTGMEIGYGVMGAIDQFTAIRGELDTGTFDTLRFPTKVKGLPDNEVYIGGVRVNQERVLPVSPRKMYLVMPPGNTGETHIYANVNDISISMERPYKYVDHYNKEVDMNSIKEFVCDTKSPFRIAESVPDGSVGLATLSTPDLDVDNNMSFIDMSERELENISNHLRGEFSISNPVDSSDLATYSGQIDTQDVLISNRSVMLRNVTQPAPLYYKYLVGRGRYYLSQAGANEASDIGIVRSAISIVNSDGAPISMSNYPFDLEMSTLDINGNPLPPSVFSVVLFTNKLFLPEQTVFIKYRAVDAINKFKEIPERQEIINPVPIIYGDASNRRDSFSLTFADDGTYDVAITTG